MNDDETKLLVIALVGLFFIIAWQFVACGLELGKSYDAEKRVKDMRSKRD